MHQRSYSKGGLPTEALLAQIAVSKYAAGLPLYRQAGIYTRDGIALERIFADGTTLEVVWAFGPVCRLSKLQHGFTQATAFRFCLRAS